MKIAIPTNDQKTILQHFGKAQGFLIVEAEDGSVKNKHYMINNITAHASEHKHEASSVLHVHSHTNNHSHSHEDIFRAIGDCDTVIAGGMGRRLYKDFEERGISVFISSETHIDTAIKKLLDNKLDNNTSKCCNH